MNEEIVLASGNRGKLKEFEAMLEDFPLQMRPQSDFDVPEAVEDGLSFVENAIIKARNAAAYTKRAALADDSGIAVDALGGAPGIYSARYAGARANDGENLTKLLKDTAHLNDAARRCHFICVIAYLRAADDPLPIICQGVWSGRLLREPSGTNGFGYDPIFWVETHQCSSAELTSELKNRMSHRAQALAALRQALAIRYGLS